VQARLREEGIPIQVVARLAVSPQKLGEIAGQMNRVYTEWLQNQSQGEPHDSRE
jgi:hypothetical protein